MKPFQKLLTEIFDNPYSYKRNVEQSKEISKMLKNSTVEVYDTVDVSSKKKRLRFYVFIHEGAWELHFANEENDFDPDYLKLFKKNEVSRIIATAMDIMTIKLKEKTIPIRLYAIDERMTNFYLKAIQSRESRLEVRKIENFLGADGNRYPLGYLIRRDTRSFVKENLT